MTTFKYMWGDRNPIAKFNPARWSSAHTWETGIPELTGYMEKGEAHSVLLSIARGKEQYFATIKEAIEYLDTVNPDKLSKKAAAENAQKRMEELKEKLEHLPDEIKKAEEAKEDADKAVAHLEGKQKELQAEIDAPKESNAGAATFKYMWGDRNPVAFYNPARWSGAHTWKTGRMELTEHMEKGASHPVWLSIARGKAQHFKTIQETIEYLDSVDPEKANAEAAEKRKAELEEELKELPSEIQKLKDIQEDAQQALAHLMTQQGEAQATLEAAQKEVDDLLAAVESFS